MVKYFRSMAPFVSYIGSDNRKCQNMFKNVIFRNTVIKNLKAIKLQNGFKFY